MVIGPGCCGAGAGACCFATARSRRALNLPLTRSLSSGPLYIAVLIAFDGDRLLKIAENNEIWLFGENTLAWLSASTFLGLTAAGAPNMQRCVDTEIFGFATSYTSLLYHTLPIQVQKKLIEFKFRWLCGQK
ncbi:MAG: hypothetical protein H9882_04465 [Candidatus Fournierella pullistercoris]|uniref:Uncharacterized protein n=1 Tax=Candidatus Allofournierella pullistercoris TaxID=2838597 RepID=A0A948WSA8_9FIRM|nr:hypothetical protein [Candidatus Fournierella pullistercoris]